MTMVQSSLDHQLRHSQEATLKTDVGGHRCPAVTGKGSKGGQTASSSAKALFLQRSVHKRHAHEESQTQLAPRCWLQPSGGPAHLPPLPEEDSSLQIQFACLSFLCPWVIQQLSAVLPEPRQLGPDGGTPFSHHIQTWQWNLVHYTLEKSGLALTSGHCLGTFPKAQQIFQMKIKQCLRRLLVLAAATVGGRLQVSCVTPHSPVQPNAHLRQRGEANLFLKEKKVFWMNKS